MENGGTILKERYKTEREVHTLDGGVQLKWKGNPKISHN